MELWAVAGGPGGEGREFLVSGELGTVDGIPGFVDLGRDGRSWLPDQSELLGLVWGAAPGDCVCVGP